MKKILSILLVLILLGGVTVTPVMAWDANNFKYEFDKDVINEDERNDSIETAKTIKSGQTVKATLTVPDSWKGVTNGMTVMDDFCDMDYFEFTLTERSDILVVALPITHCKEDYIMMTVSDEKDKTIFKSFSNADERPDQIIAMITDTLDAGTYYITFLCGVDNSRYNGAEYMGYFEAYPIGDDVSAETSEGSEEGTANNFDDALDMTPEYKTAISYMLDEGIMSGYANNTFIPKGGLTRGAAAKIIGNLTLGAFVAERLVTDTAPFTDVPASHTFAGYIKFCVKEGICNGYNDNTFKPAAPLSTGAYAKMLLNWARYTGDTSRYVGEKWSSYVYLDAVAAGIIDENVNLGEPVTREYAAYMAYQAVKYAEAHGKMPTVQQPTVPQQPTPPQYPSAITLSSSSLNIKQNSGGSVAATITPSNAVDKSITWSSSNRAVATVDSSGYAWGIAPGTAVITAKTANGLTASYTVTVSGAGKTPTPQSSTLGAYVAPTVQEYMDGYYRSMPCVEIDSAGGIKVKWEAKYLGEKTVAYYTVYCTLKDTFGSPIKDEISGKTQIACRVHGPVKQNERLLLYNVIGYNSVCNVVEITGIKLEFTDGTSVSGDYTFLVRGFNPRHDGF